jgi:predicted DNA-binding antitoxin AbrB/MazE fold protein
MIRAIYRSGVIQPLDDVPADWQEGEELTVDLADPAPTAEELDAWVADVKAATANISDEDHDKFMAALAEVEAESKELARREMERSE